MKAISSASGGVIFMPDANDPDIGPISYRDLVDIEKEKSGPKPFGKRSNKSDALGNAA